VLAAQPPSSDTSKQSQHLKGSSHSWPSQNHSAIAAHSGSHSAPQNVSTAFTAAEHKVLAEHPPNSLDSVQPQQSCSSSPVGAGVVGVDVVGTIEVEGGDGPELMVGDMLGDDVVRTDGSSSSQCTAIDHVQPLASRGRKAWSITVYVPSASWVMVNVSRNAVEQSKGS
jgi:hypothetical protein